jgi:hypothetical protein
MTEGRLSKPELFGDPASLCQAGSYMVDPLRNEAEETGPPIVTSFPSPTFAPLTANGGERDTIVAAPSGSGPPRRAHLQSSVRGANRLVRPAWWRSAVAGRTTDFSCQAFDVCKPTASALGKLPRVTVRGAASWSPLEESTA